MPLVQSVTGTLPILALQKVVKHYFLPKQLCEVWNEHNKCVNFEMPKNIIFISAMIGQIGQGEYTAEDGAYYQHVSSFTVSGHYISKLIGQKWNYFTWCCEL